MAETTKDSLDLLVPQAGTQTWRSDGSWWNSLDRTCLSSRRIADTFKSQTITLSCPENFCVGEYNTMQLLLSFADKLLFKTDKWEGHRMGSLNSWRNLWEVERDFSFQRSKRNCWAFFGLFGVDSHQMAEIRPTPLRLRPSCFSAPFKPN